MPQETTGITTALRARADLLKLPNGRPYIEDRQTYVIYSEGPNPGVCLGFLIIGPSQKDELTAWFRGWATRKEFHVSFSKTIAPDYGWYEICRLVFYRTGHLLYERWPDDRVRQAAH